jgi:hypothetical protein
MRPSEYIIIAVAFCMVVSVFGIAYVSTAADYGLTAQLNASDFSKQYNVIKNISSMGSDMQSKLQSAADQEGGASDTWDSILIRGAWSTLWELPKLFSYTFGVITTTMTTLGIPGELLVGLLTIITIVILFAMIQAIMKWEL